jgi:very-short-patch-repair endonuclease
MPTKTPKPLSAGEETFALHCRAHGLIPQREFQFDPKRKWRADFCFVPQKLIVEIEGGVWTGGRHTTGKGMTADIAKYNRATLMGYRILRYTPEMVMMGTAINEVLEAL